jgi:hypothetical protein
LVSPGIAKGRHWPSHARPPATNGDTIAAQSHSHGNGCSSKSDRTRP